MVEIVKIDELKRGASTGSTSKGDQPIIWATKGFPRFWYRLCPLFDFGLSLLSDLNDYPMGQDTYSMIPRVKAKPFDDSFIEQVNCVNELWGIKLTFNVSRHEIFDAFKLFDGMYDEAILRRVENILREKMQAYAFLFK